MDKMNEDELHQYFVEKMRECVEKSGYDREAGHVNADNLLEELLDKLGFGDVTSEYAQVRKWYA